MNISKSKLQAMENGLPYYFTGKQCKRGHVANRRVSDNRCLECSKDQAAKYRKDHLKEISARSKVVRKDNLDFFRNREREYRERNINLYKSRELKYREQHREKAKEVSANFYQENIDHCRQVRRNYSKNNRGRLNALEAKRHARKLNATPEWASSEKILKIYEACRQLTETTGIRYTVDHIIPLQSDFICGLHCEDNLQILTRDDNLKKSNNYEQV